MQQTVRYWVGSCTALMLVACGGGGGNPGGPTSPPTPKATAADAARYLEQASFGPTLAGISAVQSSGVAAAIDQQLATASTGYPASSS
jgi:hypothetical protein